MEITAENLVLASVNVADAFTRARSRCWWFWLRTISAINQCREEFKRADRLGQVLQAMPKTAMPVGGWSPLTWLIAILIVLSIIPFWGIIFGIILAIFELVNLGPIDGPWHRDGWKPLT